MTVKQLPYLVFSMSHEPADFATPEGATAYRASLPAGEAASILAPLVANPLAGIVYMTDVRVHAGDCPPRSARRGRSCACERARGAACEAGYEALKVAVGGPDDTVTPFGVVTTAGRTEAMAATAVRPTGDVVFAVVLVDHAA